MSGEIDFFEPMTRLPTVTHNALEPHIDAKGELGIHKQGKLLRAEGIWEAHLAPHAPRRPMRGALSVSILLMLSAKGARHEQGEPIAEAPDLDNWSKTIIDVMKRLGYFGDDGQIAELYAAKLWWDPQGVAVRVSPTSGTQLLRRLESTKADL